MPPVNAMLMIDFESTGLLASSGDHPVPTGLEVSWTVVDHAGVQMTPLRHRFTALPLAEDSDGLDGCIITAPAPTGETSDGPPDWFSETSGWEPVTDYPGEAVRKMHRDNGLMDDFTRFCRENYDLGSGRRAPVVQEWDDLDRLLLDDLVHAGVSAGEPGTVTLGGGGVSHYEDRFLRPCAPLTMGLPAMHYSGGLDVSTLLRVLSTRYLHATTTMGDHVPEVGKADQVLTLARAEQHIYALPPGWADVELEPEVDGWASSDRDVAAWMAAERDPHRAAPGVARALAAYRLIPYLVDMLGAGYADARDALAALKG